MGKYRIVSYIKGLYTIVDEKDNAHGASTDLKKVEAVLKEMNEGHTKKDSVEKAKPRPKKEEDPLSKMFA